MKNTEKKAIKVQLLKLNKTKKQRSEFWAYYLSQNVTRHPCGYVTAQDLARLGYKTLSIRDYDPERAD